MCLLASIILRERESRRDMTREKVSRRNFNYHFQMTLEHRAGQIRRNISIGKANDLIRYAWMFECACLSIWMRGSGMYMYNNAVKCKRKSSKHANIMHRREKGKWIMHSLLELLDNQGPPLDDHSLSPSLSTSLSFSRYCVSQQQARLVCLNDNDKEERVIVDSYLNRAFISLRAF